MQIQIHSSNFRDALRGFQSIVLVILLASPAMAVNLRWSNASGGSFHTTTNWIPYQVPTTNDTAEFSSLDQSFAVNFSANATSKTVEVQTGNVTFNLNGYTYQQTQNSTGVGLSLDPSVVVGDRYEYSAKLTLMGGTMQSVQGRAGNEEESNGEIVVTGNTTTWNNSGPIVIGHSGTGTLRVEAGAKVTSATSYVGYETTGMGHVVVKGIGSSLTNAGAFYVGLYGTGSLTVENGGTLTTQTLLASLSSLYGNGTIFTKGIVTDGVDLVFDATHGLQQTIGFGSGGQIHLDLDGSGIFGAGHAGTGTALISQGRIINSTSGAIGYKTGSQGEVTVSGANSTWNTNAGTTIGVRGNGKLRIEAGGIVTGGAATVGSGDNTSGEVKITGANSHWNNSGELTVGNNGAGKVSIENGAKLSSLSTYLGRVNDSSGEVIVTGANSIWTNTVQIYVGNSGTGNLVIEAGGKVVTTNVTLGQPTTMDVQSSVVVNGIGSTLELTSSLQINQGQINIENGATLSSTSGRIDTYSKTKVSKVIVTGNGSLWKNSGLLEIGHTANGELSIENGAKVTSRDAEVGTAGYSRTSGKVTVTGMGSTWTSTRDLTLGSYNPPSISGVGIVTVENGGLIEVARTLRVFFNSTLNLEDGGTIKALHFDASGGTFNFRGGTLNVTGNFTGSLNVTEFSRITGTTKITGNLVNQGTAAPGNSPGILTITGDYTQDGTGVLQIELGGLTVGTQYDRLAVTGNTILDGTLDVSLINSFALADGQTFTILTTGGTSTGEFTGLADNAIVGTFGGYRLLIDYTSIGVNLYTQAVPEPSSITLALLGLAGIAGMAYSRGRKR